MSNIFTAGPSFALNLNSSKTLPLAIVNKSGQPLSWQAVWAADNGGQNWLTLDRTGGSLIANEVQTIYITAKSAQAVGAPGDFSGKLTFTPTVGGIAQEVVVDTVELHVSSGVYTDNGPKAPTGSLSHIDFAAQLVNTTVQVQSNPSTLQLFNTEVNQVQWTMTSKVSWLTLKDITTVVPPGWSQIITGTWSNVGDQLKVSVMVDQNSLAKTSNYRTDLVLTLKFTGTAMAGLEPTSILIPITVTVP